MRWSLLNAGMRNWLQCQSMPAQQTGRNRLLSDKFLHFGTKTANLDRWLLEYCLQQQLHHNPGIESSSIGSNKALMMLSSHFMTVILAALSQLNYLDTDQQYNDRTGCSLGQ